MTSTNICHFIFVRYYIGPHTSTLTESYLSTLFVCVSVYCVEFLFCLYSSCVPYVASFSGLSVFSNVYSKRLSGYTLSFFDSSTGRKQFDVVWLVYWQGCSCFLRFS